MFLNILFRPLNRYTSHLGSLAKLTYSHRQREASARDDRISLERVLHARIVQLEDAVSALQQRLSTTEQQLRNSVSQHVYDALLRRHATTHARYFREYVS